METIIHKEALQAQIAALPLQVVLHVLWHTGDLILGEQPGGFVTALLTTIARADSENRLKLSLVYEPYVNGMQAVQRLTGLELMRDRAKAARL